MYLLSSPEAIFSVMVLFAYLVIFLCYGILVKVFVVHLILQSISSGCRFQNLVL